MTEAEWLQSEDPAGMLWLLRGKATYRLYPSSRGVPRFDASRRKLRLFACACCRAIWPELVDERSREAVAVAERFADGGASDYLRRKALFRAREALHAIESAGPPPKGDSDRRPRRLTAAGAARYAAFPRFTADPATSASDAALRIHDSTAQVRRSRGRRHQCDLLRDIFGNPFRPVAFSPAWRTDTAATLARRMYESRDFGAMPILADALQDAACDNADILGHCRGPGPHVRGCWVVDLVLGKE